MVRKVKNKTLRLSCKTRMSSLTMQAKDINQIDMEQCRGEYHRKMHE